MNRPYLLIVVIVLCLQVAVGARAQPADPTEEPAAPVRPWNSVEEPWRLIPRIEPLRLDIYGWADIGYTYNTEKTSSQFNGVVLFNDRREDITLDQLYLVVERALERPEDHSELYLDLGGRLDAFIGYNTRFTEPIHYGPRRWNDSHEFGGIDAPQAYLQAGAAMGPMNLSLTGGRFYWPGAYESPMAPENFFYSHSYSMAYGQPKTLTGGFAKLGAELPFGSEIAALAGVHRGWENIDRHPLSNDTGYLYGLQLGSNWNRTGWDTSLRWTYIMSDETANPFIPGLKDDSRINTVVLEQQILDHLTYAFEYARGKQEQGSPYDGGSAPWQSNSHYLTLKLHRMLSLGVRYEVFQDWEGSRVGGIGRRLSGSPIVPFGFKGDFHEYALGANVMPSKNITLRGEVRHDYFKGVSGFGPRPFDDGRKNHQTIYCVDLIFTF